MRAYGIDRWIVAVAVLSLTLCQGSREASATQFQEILPGILPSAAGGAWGDYDGDGYPDLFLADGDAGTAVPVPHGPLLYHNNHNLTFTEVSESLGLIDASYPQWGAAWGDYNNDGLLDILVGDAYWPFLYEQGETGFVDAAGDAGFHIAHSSSYSQNWCDYNGDNLLDAFSSNIFGPGYLMLSNGDGTFTEMSSAAGMTGDAANDSAHGASWADYDNDGLPDLALARLAQPAKLYRNNGDGTFTDVSDESGVSIAGDCQSPVWGDYDNDGWLDLYLTAGPYLDGNGGAHWLFHNNGDGTFTNVRAAAGMSSVQTVGGGAGWADYDNDGYLDLYVGNWGTNAFLYHNNRNGTFTNLVVGSGLEMQGTYQAGAACWGDVDLDGRLDLVQCTFATDLANNRSRLFHNIGLVGNWLRVRALTSGTGDATGSDPARDAVGACVELSLDNDGAFPTDTHRTLTRLIDGGSSWLGQNEQIAQFGLGSATLVAVQVLFPDGSVVVHRGVAANQQITIRDVPADRTEIFDDVPLDDWAYEQVRGCVDNGIVSGYDDGTYHPEYAVTRDQMAVYTARALAGGDSNVPEFTGTPTFPDATDTQWAHKYIEYAVEQGVVAGYDDGDYHPDYQVDRGQMAVYIARSIVAPSGEAGLSDYVPSDPRNFPDVDSDFWAYKHIEFCVEHGVVNGYDDGDYHPEIVVTRDQMAVYVARAFGL